MTHLLFQLLDIDLHRILSFSQILNDLLINKPYQVSPCFCFISMNLN